MTTEETKRAELMGSIIQQLEHIGELQDKLTVKLEELSRCLTQIDKQTASFIQRTEYENRHSEIRDYMLRLQGMASQKSVTFATITAVSAVIISLAAVVIDIILGHR